MKEICRTFKFQNFKGKFATPVISTVVAFFNIRLFFQFLYINSLLSIT